MAADIGCIVGAVGAVLVLVPRGRAAPLVGFALLTAAVGLLASALVPGEDIRTLIDTPTRIVGVAVAALVLVVAGVVLSDRPGVVTVALLAVTPFRVPVHVGEQEAFLLIPLYAVLVVAVVGLVVRFARGRDFPELPRWMMVPAAAFIALCAISLLWSDDRRAGMIQLLFFYYPSRRSSHSWRVRRSNAGRWQRSEWSLLRLRAGLQAWASPSSGPASCTSPATSKWRTPTPRTSGRPRCLQTRACTVASWRSASSCSWWRCGLLG